MKVSVGPVQDIATVEAEKLAIRKANTVAMENVKIGEARKQIITDIAGQQMIYIFKHFEAVAFLGDEPAWLVSPSDAVAWKILSDRYPFITNEVGLTAPSAYDVAQVFINRSRQWVQIALPQERQRGEKTEAILSAQTTEQLIAAREV